MFYSDICCFFTTLMMLSAVAPKCMRNPWVGEEEGSSGTSSGGPSKLEEPWAALSERSLVVMVEQLFSHLLKVLNICAHVLDDTPPGPAMKASLIRRFTWFNRLMKENIWYHAFRCIVPQVWPTGCLMCYVLFYTLYRPLSPPWATPPPSVPFVGKARRRRVPSPVPPLWAQRRVVRPTQVNTSPLLKKKGTDHLCESQNIKWGFSKQAGQQTVQDQQL